MNVGIIDQLDIRKNKFQFTYINLIRIQTDEAFFRGIVLNLRLNIV